MTFEEDGDQTGTKFVLYNCTATRPSRSLATIEDTKTPTTQTLTVSAIPLANGNVLAMSTETTPQATLNTWHESVYMTSSTADFLVEFNSNGGTPVQSQSVPDGGTATEPDDPTKDGFTFDGWFSDLALTDEFDFTTLITTNVMLYAKWTEI
jgi:uncharacterized repeat protein (TIGR02543 family)